MQIGRLRYHYAFISVAAICLVAAAIQLPPFVTDLSIVSGSASGRISNSLYLFPSLIFVAGALASYGEIAKLLATEDRLRASQPQFFFVHFVVVLLSCLLISIITPYRIGLTRTYFLWASLFVILSAFGRFTIYLCMRIPRFTPYLMWIYWQISRIWAYLQLEPVRPVERGVSILEVGSKLQRFGYRFVQISILSLPFVVTFTGPSAFSRLTESPRLTQLIFWYSGGMSLIAIFVTLLNGLLITEIAGVQWKGEILSLKRLRKLYAPFAVLSTIYLIFQWTWTSTGLWALAFILGLVFPAFVLHAYIVTVFEPLIPKSFADSVQSISAKTDGSFLPGLTTSLSNSH